MLWFAFKLCSLYIWLQQLRHEVDVLRGCDLLSNFALCTFDYNRRPSESIAVKVVICFQTLLFVHLITTFAECNSCNGRLWFAFKLCSLYIWLQPLFLIPLFLIVVICFQTLLFVHLITTIILYSCHFQTLWFAFKLCSLYIWLQLLWM